MLSVTNAETFNDFLKHLPNASGIKLYFIETSQGYINYDEVHKKFQRLIDFNGYRRYSLSGIKELTSKESEELETDIKEGTFIFSSYDKASQKRQILVNGFNEYT